MEKKKFGQTKVGKVVKKIVTAPIRAIKTSVRKEREYEKWKDEKARRDIMNNL